jgi:signal transduction histidine kinase
MNVLPATSFAALAAEAPAPAPVPWWARVHQRLMPDYNRKAATYWWLVVLLGSAVLAHSLHAVADDSWRAWLHIVAGTVLAMLAGLVPVRIPHTANSFTAGEIFIFLLLLLNGPEAAAIASAFEAFVGSWRTSRRWTSRIASPAMAALAMFCAGSLFEAGRSLAASLGVVGDALLLPLAIGFALGYFVLNTVMVTMVARLKRNEPLRLRGFLDAFGWLSVAYAGNASVATFLFLSFRQSGIVVVVAAVPIIAILLTTGHFYFRREEAEEAVRKAREQQAAQRQMLETARQAGMAEIATNVLHNVGNVLNSVNVSVDLIAERVRGSEAASLQRVVQLLDANAQDLGRFLSEDPRGQMVPAFLGQLAQAIAEERETMIAELATLVRSVRHIKEIVATQQSYAGASSMAEAIQVCELVEDALRINTSGPSDRRVGVVKDFGQVPTLMLDKHRVLLILVNLISNARHAMHGLPQAEQRVVLRVRLQRDTEQLLVEVEDNGEGIAPEHLTRIFAHGFTTKKDGHGFGLHSCVLAAKEMGGTLVAHSDGPGHGARFTLQLPARPVETP